MLNVVVLFNAAVIVTSVGLTTREGATPYWVMITFLELAFGPLTVSVPVRLVLNEFGVALTVMTALPLPPDLLTVSQFMLLLMVQLIFEAMEKVGWFVPV